VKNGWSCVFNEPTHRVGIENGVIGAPHLADRPAKWRTPTLAAASTVA
jgi:hypothetical protein